MAHSSCRLGDLGWANSRRQIHPSPLRSTGFHKLAAQGQRIPRIAKRFDVNPETIRHIVRGTTYKEIGGPRTFGEAYISQFVGVTYNKANGKWKAYVRLNGKPKHIGYFATEIEAARAYNAAVIERGLDYPINEIGTEEI